jgi:type IV pilus assembly protein PilE
MKETEMSRSSVARCRCDQVGFSLIELMIVVAIMGILMAIAMPSYNDYVVRSKIPDATSGLSTKRVQMEQWFQDNRTYVGATACNADTTTSQYFNFSCSVAGAATTFTLQAAGKSSMAAFTYTIDESGNKGTVITSAAPSGWEATTPTPPATTGGCWVTNKGGTC